MYITRIPGANRPKVMVDSDRPFPFGRGEGALGCMNEMAILPVFAASVAISSPFGAPAFMAQTADPSMIRLLLLASLTLAAGSVLAQDAQPAPAPAPEAAEAPPAAEAAPAAATAPAVTGDAKRGHLLTYTCQGCHGITGYKNAYPNYHVPRIGGQSETYLINALTEYKEGKRKHPTMQAQAQSFSAQDIADIAAYLSGLK